MRIKIENMNSYKYLIIGTGMTADAAVRGIRELDATGSIGLIGVETDPPYNRPPLSKGLWKGKSLDSIWRKTDKLQVTLQLGRKVVSLNAEEHSVQDEIGESYSGEQILLATGGSPRRLPFGGDDILYYRFVADYERLLQMTSQSTTFTVIGGSFIGSEIAAALAMNGKKVRLLFPEAGICARAFPIDLSLFLNEYYAKKGVEVLPGEYLRDIQRREGRLLLNTQGGREIVCEGVVAGIGIQPNVELAKSAGLKIGNGISVDEYLVTSHADIYAAGDVAEFYNPALDRRMRVEHEDNANAMGRQAGRNMAGVREAYQHLPFFYSDLFDLGYEAVGNLDSRLTIEADWQDRFNKGVIYYLDKKRLNGVLLWNVWDKVPDARDLIAKPKLFNLKTRKNLIGG
jgi:NAD(P)H-nitrite reductase large subunit